MMGQSPIPVQPAVTVVDSDDLTAVVRAGMDLLNQDAMPLQSMPLRVRRVIVRLGSATIIYHSANLRVRARTSTQDEVLAYVTFGPRARGTVDGLDVRPGMMVVAEPKSEVGFVIEPGWESIALLVPPEEIRAHLIARRREGEFRWPHRVEVLRTDPPLARALFKWGKQLVRAASEAPARFDEGRVERDAAQGELLEFLLAAMRSTDTLATERSERTRQAHTRIVTIAENYVLSRAGERVRLSDLCRAADVSERTVECAFKAVTGLSPAAYLTRLRLHRVRTALLVAESGATQVSTEALKWGFWHFGEFARAYKVCFGERPSDTLRRPPQAQRESTNRARPGTRKRTRPPR